MAYRFNNTTNALMQFALGPFSGVSLWPFTFACLVKFNGVGNRKTLLAFDTSADALHVRTTLTNGDVFEWFDTGQGAASGSHGYSSTSLWYLLAITRPASATLPRFHSYDGSSWIHDPGVGTNTAAVTIPSTDKLRVGINAGANNPFDGDIVCMGLKLADSSDATVMTLSTTAFPAWQSFGFDWLVGFDAIGARSNQGVGSGGNELSRGSGISLVSDPPGWTWITATVPVANFTGTPLSGTASLSVAFTDSSTNTPTSWAWTFGDGGTSTSQNPTHSYTTSGVYTVTLVATNSAGSNTLTRTGYITVGETISYASGGGIFVY